MKTKPKLSLAEFAKITKLSEIWEIALTDFAAAEKSPLFKVDNGTYLERDVEKKSVCVGCVAGSVLFQRGRKNYNWTCNILHSRLTAIDDLRCGLVEYASESLSVAEPCDNRTMPKYEDDPRGWWVAARKLLRDLKAGERRQERAMA